MSLADRCPRCGSTDSGAWESTIEEVQSGGITYVEEKIRCDCGMLVGKFSHPQV